MLLGLILTKTIHNFHQTFIHCLILEKERAMLQFKYCLYENRMYTIGPPVPLFELPAREASVVVWNRPGSTEQASCSYSPMNKPRNSARRRYSNTLQAMKCHNKFTHTLCPSLASIHCHHTLGHIPGSSLQALPGMWLYSWKSCLVTLHHFSSLHSYWTRRPSRSLQTMPRKPL